MTPEPTPGLTPERKIAILEQRLADPTRKAMHEAYRAKLNELRSQRPTDPGRPSMMRPATKPDDVQGLETREPSVLDYKSTLVHPELANVGQWETASAASRDFARGLGDATTLGAANRVFDDQTTEDADRKRLASHGALNKLRTAGNVVGSIVPGASSVIGGAAGTVAGKAIPEGAGIGGKLISGTARGAVGAELAAPAIAGGQSLLAGNDLSQTAGRMADAATDPVNIGIGAGLGTITSAARARNTNLRDTRKESGRLIDDIEAVGGKANPNPLGEPATGGAFDTPHMKGLAEGKTGIVQEAEGTAKAMTRHNSMRYRAAKDAYGRAEQEILQEHLGEVKPTDEMFRNVKGLEEANTVNGVAADQQLQSAIDHVKSMIGPRQATSQVDTGFEGAGGQPITQAKTTTTPGRVPVEEIQILKRKLYDRAEFGQPATAENRPYRLMAGMAKDLLESVDPRFRPLNERYHKELGDIERTNDVLVGQNKPDYETRATRERRAIQTVTRAGDETTAGLSGESQLRDLADKNPTYAPLLERLMAKKASEAVRFGAPNMASSPDRWGYNLIRQNVNAAKVRLEEPATGNVGRSNPGKGSVAVHPIIEAARKKKERDRATK